jgi:hypothetical protein
MGFLSFFTCALQFGFFFRNGSLALSRNKVIIPIASISPLPCEIPDKAIF